MKITPSARILRMLGEIQFAEWQCVAELVDNAFDDFSDVLAEGQPGPADSRSVSPSPGRVRPHATPRSSSGTPDGG